MPTRNQVKEWNVVTKRINDAAFETVTTPFIIKDNVLWYGGQISSSPSGFSSLVGISAGDGSDVAEIELDNIYERGDFALDHNGYLWINGALSATAGLPCFIVVDLDNRAVVTTIFDAGDNFYLDSTLKADVENKLMWVEKDTTQLDAISTETYTVSHSITDNADSYGVDVNKGEVWVYNTTSNTIKVYESSTGTLSRTVSSTASLGSTRLLFIPDKEQVVFVTGTVSQVWSTRTYTQTGTITPPGSDVFYPHYYLPLTDELFGYYYEDSTAIESVAFYSRTSLELVHKELTTSEIGGDELSRSMVAAGGTKMFNEQCTPHAGAVYAGVFGSSGVDTIYKIVIGTLQDIPEAVPTDETFFPTTYNRELILDLTLQAFSVYDFSHTEVDSPPKVHGYLPIPDVIKETQTEIVYDNDNNVVVDGSGNTVTVDLLVSVNRTFDPRRERFKLLASQGINISLAEYNDYTFKDWKVLDGIGYDYSSFLITGYNLSGDMMRKKQTIYLLCYFERTEEIYELTSNGTELARQSGCCAQAQWDWNHSAAQGKWSREFKAYRLLRPLPSSPSAGDRLDYGERVIVTKNKLRGSGRSLSIKFTSDPGKDTKLLGWALLQYKVDEP